MVLSSDAIVQIILGVLGFLSLIITSVVVPYVRSKTTKEQRENAYVLVTLAVRAAEQIFFGAGKGEEKKKYVLEYLEKRGIKLTKEDLEVMIEAAVKELKLLEETVLQ